MITLKMMWIHISSASYRSFFSSYGKKAEVELDYLQAVVED
ncbi:hypothetical protein [Cytobacillus sp. IB215316]|nr:hypothetical protein [Cytobacillus sp. IB215316]MDX8359896.1 hypothetical protein [Cytobacillus sp. IB215316]